MYSTYELILNIYLFIIKYFIFYNSRAGNICHLISSNLKLRLNLSDHCRLIKFIKQFIESKKNRLILMDNASCYFIFFTKNIKSD